MSSLQELQSLIREKYAIEVDPHQSMKEAGIDSLALVEFLFEVEDKLGISVPEQHSNIDTLAALAEVIDQLRTQQPA